HRHGIARKRAKEEPTNAVTTRCSRHHGRRRSGSRTGVARTRTRQGAVRTAHYRRRAGPYLACKYVRASLARRWHRPSAYPTAVLVLRTPGPHGRSGRRSRRDRTAVVGRLSQRIRHGSSQEVAASLRRHGPPPSRRSEIEGPALH